MGLNIKLQFHYKRFIKLCQPLCFIVISPRDWDIVINGFENKKTGKFLHQFPETSHQNYIKQALKEGKKVPEEVLKDYREGRTKSVSNAEELEADFEETKKEAGLSK